MIAAESDRGGVVRRVLRTSDSNNCKSDDEEAEGRDEATKDLRS